MSNYTTGEMAKLCGVTVRTVQYYDSRGILCPSALSEGGRRLYSDDDLKRLKVICFLREMDIPINTIGQLLKEEHPEDVIDLLLQQQMTALREELESTRAKLEKLKELRREIPTVEHFSIESIGDIANLMDNKKKLRKLRWTMLGVGLVLEVIEWGTIIFWIKTGTWWPFALGMSVVVAGSGWISWYYFKNAAYICPKCHEVFRPRFKEAFWANHTPTTRKLTCPCCGHKGFCVETYGGEQR